MLVKDVIIIHESFFVQKGLTALLEGMQLPVTRIINGKTEPFDLTEFRRSLIFMDIKYAQEIKKDYTLRNNILAGLSAAKRTKHSKLFDGIISLNDSEDIIRQKIRKLIPQNAAIESSKNNFLSAREIEILKLVARGMSSRDIADKIFLSRHTVNTHRKNICAKLGIKTVSGLTLYAYLNKIIR